MVALCPMSIMPQQQKKRSPCSKWPLPPSRHQIHVLAQNQQIGFNEPVGGGSSGAGAEGLGHCRGNHTLCFRRSKSIKEGLAGIGDLRREGNAIMVVPNQSLFASREAPLIMLDGCRKADVGPSRPQVDWGCPRDRPARGCTAVWVAPAVATTILCSYCEVKDGAESQIPNGSMRLLGL